MNDVKDFDDDGLAGKVAIISGGGARGEGIGNGRAAAILLARAGTKVVVVDRDLDLAQRLSLIHISEPTRQLASSRMPSSA